MSRPFANIPPELASRHRARVVIVPVPFEGTVTYLPGTSRAPAAVLEASRALELYEADLGYSPCRVGIHVAEDVEARSPEQMVSMVEHRVASVAADGKLPLVLGGEHTVAVGAFRALRALHPDLCFLYLDAHADLRPSYKGNPLSHASVAARLWEMGSGLHVGLRSLSKAEARQIDERGIPCVWAWETRARGWVDDVMDRLSGPVYLSLDLDVFDPSVLPAVGCPEPGGLDWEEVDTLLRALAARHGVVGLDVSELAPLPNMAWCEFLTARLLYRIIGYLFAGDK